MFSFLLIIYFCVYLPILRDSDVFIEINGGFLNYSIQGDHKFEHHAGVIVTHATFGVELSQETLFQLIAIR